MGMARPSKYESHVQPKLMLIEAWARDGLTDEQIAENLGIGIRTFYEYKNEFPQFAQALKNGKEVVDVMVENALLKAALGYEYEEDAIGKDGVYTLKKYAQPNTTALIFWLKNRRPGTWRDKQDIDMNANIEYSIKMPEPPQGA
jgi:MarR-like DNA-binding transcriptional regulator SgrR of sgrS sRNA